MQEVPEFCRIPANSHILYAAVLPSGLLSTLPPHSGTNRERHGVVVGCSKDADPSLEAKGDKKSRRIRYLLLLASVATTGTPAASSKSLVFGCYLWYSQSRPLLIQLSNSFPCLCYQQFPGSGFVLMSLSVSSTTESSFSRAGLVTSECCPSRQISAG